jgi:ATP-dependent protease ClpP protease subunit
MARINKDDIDKWFDSDIYVPTRTIWVGTNSNWSTDEESGTDWQMAERLAKGLWLLDQTDSPITVLMNNIGGDVYHMWAMYDLIKACKSHVTVKCVGYCMSAATVILQAADERVLSPNVGFMIHYGTWGLPDNLKEAKRWVDEADRLYKNVAHTFLDKIREKKPAYTYDDVDRLLERDTPMSAFDAVELGLADRVEG